MFTAAHGVNAFVTETQPSDKLRYTKLKVLSHSECRERLKTYEYDEEIMICAFQEDTDACQV